MGVNMVAETFASSFVVDTVFLVLIATFLAYIARLIKQPLIVAYLIAGIVLGPIGLGLVKDEMTIRSIARIGIIFLLFIVGLEIDIRKLARLGKHVIGATLAQVVLTFAGAYFVAIAFGLDSVNAVYAGLILAFSSTMVVLKLLSDEEEMYTLHGRIITGILLVQDVILIIAMAIVLNISEFSVPAVLGIVGKGIVLVAVAYIAGRFVVNNIFYFAAKAEELLFLVSIAVCFFFVLLAYLFGYPLAIGAFIAGVVLASTPYNVSIVGRVVPLRDFFSIIFFVALGMQLRFVDVPYGLVAAFLGISILLKPLVLFVMLNLFRYEGRTAFLSSAPLLQISEFSLILIAQLSDISSSLFSITIIVAGISIAASPYIIRHGGQIANLLYAKGKGRGRRDGIKGAREVRGKGIVLFGCHRVGNAIVNKFAKRNIVCQKRRITDFFFLI
ncbi:cation:proton antiporter [archaeon]|nr:cation:proton antiporter [archaeon]